MRAQTYKEYTLLDLKGPIITFSVLCLPALGSNLTEGDTVNAAVINSLAWDSRMLKCVSGSLEAGLRICRFERI